MPHLRPAGASHRERAQRNSNASAFKRPAAPPHRIIINQAAALPARPSHRHTGGTSETGECATPSRNRANEMCACATRKGVGSPEGRYGEESGVCQVGAQRGVQGVIRQRSPESFRRQEGPRRLPPSRRPPRSCGVRCSSETVTSVCCGCL
jgi:hypothetical protein